MAAVVMSLQLAGCTTGETNPELELADSVAEDLAALSHETFAAFVAAAGGLQSCIGSPRLEAVANLDELALYDPATSSIQLRVPATGPSLRHSLIHELAHHVEATCESHVHIRSHFMRAQGLPGSGSWFDAENWSAAPSEQFAEAVVEVVLGGRDRHLLLVRITPQARRVVDAWLGGDGSPAPQQD